MVSISSLFFPARLLIQPQIPLYDTASLAPTVNNFVPAAKPPSIISKLAAPLILTEADKRGLERSEWFASDASAYAAQHATRPATIGYAIASSPVALLAW